MISKLLCLLPGCMAFLMLLQSSYGQLVERDSQGLYELKSPRLTLHSDIPIDDELKSWPSLIEQSLQQWQVYFDVDAERMAGLHVDATWIGDRPRLTQLGVLDGVPAFDEGYQYGDRIYLKEQPTIYFRRHLFLHEATHWIVWKLYGGGGSPWFMEGMAEMQATHSLSGRKLLLGVIPASREQVSGWGRLRMIHETLDRTEAPSLSQIFAYGNEREDHIVRYSWSWAACVFFTHHPKYGPLLRDLYREKLDYSDSLSVRYKERLASDWENVQVDWNAFVSDFDFGYDLERSSVHRSLSPSATELKPGVPSRIQLAVDRGWQPSGVLLEANRQLRIRCSGIFSLRTSAGVDGTKWNSEPNGVTYQYYRGNPMGAVIASVVSRSEPEETKRWKTFHVGAETIFTSTTSGELFLKVNEPSKSLWDNSGAVSVEISDN